MKVDTVVISSQHCPEVDSGAIEKDLIEQVILKVIPIKYLENKTKFLINPTGRFIIGGPQGDTDLPAKK